MGKQAGASAEELEFIFEAILRGLSDKEILYEMEETVFPKRNPRFIRDRRKHFDASKKVLQIQLEKEIDPVVVKSRMEHRDKLVAVVSGLIMNNLDTVFPTGKGSTFESEYLIKNGGVDSPEYSITKEQLSNTLTRNIEIICDLQGDWLFHECFLAHLGAEITDVQTKGICKVVEEQPYELIRILRILAESKNFKGTCPTCKE